jgi:hypothetical protein
MSVVQPRSRVSLAGRAVLMCAFAVAAVTAPHAQGLSYFSPTDSLTAARALTIAAHLNDGTVLLIGDTISTERYDPIVGRFGPAAALREARSDSSAVELPGGAVLVVGGRDGEVSLATAERYEPATGAFTGAGLLGTPRRQAALARLHDGRILIAGGANGQTTLASAELYDPANGVVTPAGEMTSARIGSAATLTDGTVIVIGGASPDGLATSAELYEPAVGRFTHAAALNIPRAAYVVTPLADGRVLVSGGIDRNGALVADSEIYDPAARSFRLAGRLLIARHGHSAVRLQDGTVLIVGGKDASGVLRSTESYDPAAGTYAADAPLGESRSAPIAVALADGGALVAGGRGPEGSLLVTAERYFRRRGDTAITVTSSLPTSTYGQTVNYTAVVTSVAGIPAGVVQFLDGGVPLGEARLDAAGRALLSTAATVAGTRVVTARYEGSPAFNASESGPIQQVVAKATAAGTLVITPIQRQYSDLVTFTATVSPAGAAQSVTFNLGTTAIGTAQVIGGSATLTTPVLASMPPGVRFINAVFNQAVPNYTLSSISKTMSIVKEDARITGYAGYGSTVFTACRTCTTAKLVLKADVSDISVTPDAAGDTTPGDIRNATVTFINHSTSATIATVPVVAESGVTTRGEAKYEWIVDIGSAQSKTFYIRYVVGGLYTRSTYDYFTITVSRPK